MRILSLALSILMIFATFSGCGNAASSTTASAAETTSQPSSGAVEDVLNTELFTDENAVKVNLNNENGTYKISAPGVYSLEGELNGQIEISVSKETKVKLILNGVEITNSNAPAICITSADKVIISSAAGTENNISSTGTFDDEAKEDAAIYSKDDLTLNGEGIINISSTKHGVVSKNDLKLNGGTIIVNSSKKGFEGKDSITVKEGTYSVDSGNFCLESEGDIEILGGELTLTSQSKDGIKTPANTVMSGGKVNILKSKEGIESQTVTISGGELSIFSTDDGINASTDTTTTGEVAALKKNPEADTDKNAVVSISGGNVSIVAGGDGIDSNGYIQISGGFTTVSTPNGNGDCALDYGIEGIISGGTVMACGDGGMAEAFTEQTTQGYILYNFDEKYAAGTKVVLLDESNNELMRMIPDQSFSSVLLSDSTILSGKTYTLVVDEDVYEINMNSNAFLSGVNGFGPQGGMRPNFENQNGPQPQDGQQPTQGNRPPNMQKP